MPGILKMIRARYNTTRRGKVRRIRNEITSAIQHIDAFGLGDVFPLPSIAWRAQLACSCGSPYANANALGRRSNFFVEIT